MHKEVHWLCQNGAECDRNKKCLRCECKELAYLGQNHCETQTPCWRQESSVGGRLIK